MWCEYTFLHQIMYFFYPLYNKKDIIKLFWQNFVQKSVR